MPRSVEEDLTTLDPKIDRTFHRLVRSSSLRSSIVSELLSEFISVAVDNVEVELETESDFESDFVVDLSGFDTTRAIKMDNQDAIS